MPETTFEVGNIVHVNHNNALYSIFKHHFEITKLEDDIANVKLVRPSKKTLILRRIHVNALVLVEE